MFRRRLLIALATLIVPGLASAGPPDAKAEAAVSRMLDKMGGPDAPYAVDSIAFTFAVERDGKVGSSRRHVWRPKTGDHTVSGTGKDGVAFSTEWNIHTKKGTATRGATALTGADLAAALEKAWQMWVNDTYWLLMPYKLRDKGVHLAWDGEGSAGGKTYDKVKVTFDKVGLTPGDTYWAWIARDTSLMERWSFVLEGQQPPPSEFEWKDWKAYGPLWLSDRKQSADGKTAILTSEIEVK